MTYQSRTAAVSPRLLPTCTFFALLATVFLLCAAPAHGQDRMFLDYSNSLEGFAEDGETGVSKVPDTGETQEQKGVSYTLTLKAWNRYLGGNAGVFHEEPVAQYDLFVSFPGCWYVDLWVSTGVDGTDANSDFGDEIDYNAGCSRSTEYFNWDVGVLYIDAYRLGEGPDGDVVDLYLSVDRDFSEWNMSFKLEHYIAGGSSLKGGQLAYLKASRDFSVSSSRSVDVTTGLTFDNGAFGFDPGVFLVIEVGLSVPVSDHLSLRPALKGSTPLTGIGDGRSTHWAAGIGVSTGF